MPFTKRVTFIAKLGCEEKLKAVLEAMVAPSKAEPGLLFYEIAQYKDNPQKFMAFETWADKEALQSHKQTEHYKVYKSSYEALCKYKYTDDLELLG